MSKLITDRFVETLIGLGHPRDSALALAGDAARLGRSLRSEPLGAQEIPERGTE